MLQISTSTVSRALSDHPNISDGVKAKVRATAEAFHYQPNDFAINFRKKSSKVIGLIIPKISMFFIPSIIAGISNKLQKENYNFFILSSEESLELEKAHLQTCCNSGVDGIIISLSKNTENFDHFKIIDDLEIPLVMFDKTLEASKYPEVVFDNIKSAEDCVKKLIAYNCKNILAVFGNKNMHITKKREAGFFNIINENSSIKYQTIYSDSAEEAKEAIKNIDNLEQFDGIFAMSDEVLAGVNIALQIKKITDFQSLKIMAISEGIIPQYFNSNYEYIKNDGLAMGAEAAELLLKQIKQNA
jgi:LacI family transcriptional regulator